MKRAPFTPPFPQAEEALAFESLDLKNIPSPVHLTDEVALEKNLKILETAQQKTGAHVLLALKAFAQFSLFPLIASYLKGATASSLFEARLAYEELAAKKNLSGKNLEVHACAPAYPPEDFRELWGYLDHLVFNSFQQFRFFKKIIDEERKKKHVSLGLRVNPEHSEVKTRLYDPCAPGSRLGARLADFPGHEAELEELEGLHFHSLCELGSDALARTWERFEKKFGDILPRLQWLNLGGGHHITAPDYDLELLCELLQKIRTKYKNLSLYLEPGEAVALNSGVLLASVLDIVPSPDGSYPSAILDISATAHMPDVLEMPYRPEIFSRASWAAEASPEHTYNYRLGGLTCLSGDVIGDYAFAEPLSLGQKLFFTDMAHYTMVKSSNFNGVRSPAIAIANTKSKKVRLIKKFAYEDYKSRLS